MNFCPGSLINKLVLLSAIVLVALRLSTVAIPAEPAGRSLAPPGILPTAEIARRVSHRHRGVVTEIALEVEKGSLVYEVEANGADGKKHEYLLDPVSGKLLAEKTIGVVAGSAGE